jgi:hypothetical protein
LKLDASSLRDDLRDEVHQRLQAVNWPLGIQGKPRQYQQATFVLYEWDFGFLQNVRDVGKTAASLATTLDLARQALG